jgi:hypothetical protein
MHARSHTNNAFIYIHLFVLANLKCMSACIHTSSESLDQQRNNACDAFLDTFLASQNILPGLIHTFPHAFRRTSKSECSSRLPVLGCECMRAYMHTYMYTCMHIMFVLSCLTTRLRYFHTNRKCLHMSFVRLMDVLHVFMRICMYVCMYIYIYTHIGIPCIYTYTHTNIIGPFCALARGIRGTAHLLSAWRCVRTRV